MKKLALCLILVLLTVGTFASAQDGNDFLFGDALPTAPELAARGEYTVGVTTMELTNPEQIDIVNSTADEVVMYDRNLTVEIWYPGTLPADAAERVTYEETLGRADVEGSFIPFTFDGRAARDIVPDMSGAPYPLVVVSHGFPGSRFMMTYLTENLASKGYVVVSIGHTESTFLDVSAFASTLYFRTIDQRFVIDEMDRLSAEDGMLGGLLDAQNTGLIGYSMGGYGALNTLGAGYNQILQGFLGPVSAPLAEGSPDLQADSRVKAAVLFAPFGGDLSVVGAPGLGFWNPSALEVIETPTFWIAGSMDDVAGYDGIVSLFDGSVNSDRYLLTYDNALHNVAPNPPPAEAVNLPDYERYADPVWDEATINNINQHFITAFLGLHLQGDAEMSAYLDVAVENSNDGVVSLDDEGNPTEEHTYWTGFAPRTALGMSLRHP